MLIADCIPCRHGQHAQCQGVYAPPVPGMIGGAKCGCKGDCAERYRVERDHPLEGTPPPDLDV